MERLFGIPLGGLAAAVAALLAVSVAGLGVLALRNRVLLRLGLRHVRRRPARTALIVVGLMLGTTIITSALTTGDTMSRTIRSDVLRSLGHVDEIVRPKGASGPTDQVGDFEESVLDAVDASLERSPLVDGVAPAIIVPVAVQDLDSRQTEPRVTLFASDAARLVGFGAIVDDQGRTRALSELGAGQAFLTSAGAEELNASAGHRLTVLAGPRSAQLQLSAVVDYDGAGSAGPSLLMPLDAAQALLGMEGRLNAVLVSNAGGAESGAARTDAVVELLEPTLSPLGLEAGDVKRDGLDAADEVGAVFMTVFTTFGSFSVAAGILLIFLVFVMLAAERRSEMGVSRAVGMHRRHLVQTFLFEGALYDVVAAAVGAALGVAVAFAMVSLMARAFGPGDGLELRYAVTPRSLVVAYGLGVVLTLAVVAVSAWRVSVLNITTAIRNLPDPRLRVRTRARWLRGLAGVGLGALLCASGVSSGQAAPTMAGASIVIVSIVPVSRALGAPDRLAYTLGGGALVVLWVLPFGTLDALFGTLRMDFSIWILGGLLIVLGATWTIMYNADLILAAVQATLGRTKALAPILRTSIAYPLRNRFRTGVTLAMFTLVVFNLVVGSVTVNAFTRLFDQPDTFGGGFDVIANVAPGVSLADPDAELRAALGAQAGEVSTAAAQSLVPVEARQSGDAGEFGEVPLRGLDDAFLTANTYQFAALAHGYADADAVWNALAADPGLAVVDATAAPRRSNFGFGGASPLRLRGFYLEDAAFEPVPVTVRDPQTGAESTVRVIGVLPDTAVMLPGLSASQRTVEVYGERAAPSTYLLAMRDGADHDAAAASLESGLLAHGVEADSVESLVEDAAGANRTVNRLILGFMGMGLIVGVAALGVISARSVVERRQQIGVLRAIGFRRRMVQGSFLLEASFIALSSLAVGVGLGLLMGYNVIADQRSQPAWGGLRFAVPWATLGVVFVVVYLGALVATAAPAKRAARLAPAEALRYQ